MNLKEFSRVTLPSLPNSGEKEQRIIIQKFVDAFKLIFKRDEDKEKRLRALEVTRSGGVSRTTVEALFTEVPPVYANNAAAVAGGLTVGERYRTGGDPDILCVVH
jgi:hypothetical protein